MHRAAIAAWVDDQLAALPAARGSGQAAAQPAPPARSPLPARRRGTHRHPRRDLNPAGSHEPARFPSQLDDATQEPSVAIEELNRTNIQSLYRYMPDQPFNWPSKAAVLGQTPRQVSALDVPEGWVEAAAAPPAAALRRDAVRAPAADHSLSWRSSSGTAVRPGQGRGPAGHPVPQHVPLPRVRPVPLHPRRGRGQLPHGHGAMGNSPGSRSTNAATSRRSPRRGAPTTAGPR